MRHPTDLLPDYLLGVLPDTDAARVKSHLDGCRQCQEELKQLGDVTVALTEALPPVPPPAHNWQVIERRLADTRTQSAAPPQPRPTAPRHRFGWALIASLGLLLTGGGLLWGYRSHTAFQQVQAERRTVANWLSRPEVTAQALQDRAGERLGSVLFLPDGRALFVLRDAPPRGQAYQAWGHQGDRLVSLRVAANTVFEVSWAGFESLYLSLEPSGGSPRPTHPLSYVPL